MLLLFLLWSQDRDLPALTVEEWDHHLAVWDLQVVWDPQVLIKVVHHLQEAAVRAVVKAEVKAAAKAASC